MLFFNKKKILVTHDGTFHADDLFAAATLSILHNGHIKIIRSRDLKNIAKADYVFDVGGEYSEDKKIFDHHQQGGAGVRPNGIPYASFGLVWKSYGEKICKSKEVADRLEKKIVEPIDAIDNGIDIVKPIFDNVLPYGAEQVFLSYIPTWKEKARNTGEVFLEKVKEVTALLKREIEVAKVDVEGRKLIIEAYKNSDNKKVILLENDFPRYLYQAILSSFPEPVYAIIPSSHSNMWKVEAIHKEPHTMESRKLFPEAWRGSFNGDSKFKELTGVEDAIFCHKNGFLAIANSKEGAIKLADKALKS